MNLVKWIKLKIASKGLRSSNSDTRGRYATMLGELGDPRAIPPLLWAIENPILYENLDGDTLQLIPGVKPALRRLRDAAHDAVLAELRSRLNTVLARPQSSCGSIPELAEILAEAPSTAFQAEMVRALPAQNLHLRAIAVQTLGRCKNPEWAPAIAEALEKSLSGAPTGISVSVTDCFDVGGVRMTPVTDTAIQCTCLTALERLGRPETLPTIISAYRKSSDSYVRRNAVSAIGVIDTDEARAVLEEALSDADKEVRAKAAYVLDYKATPGMFPLLVRALKNPESFVRSYAADGLARLGNKSAVAELEAALKVEENDYTRKSITSALRKLNG